MKTNKNHNAISFSKRQKKAHTFDTLSGGNLLKNVVQLIFKLKNNGNNNQINLQNKNCFCYSGNLKIIKYEIKSEMSHFVHIFDLLFAMDVSVPRSG